ncbi:MAG: hypothetical protein VX694_10800 [Planctomycetota bacterium]|nr:hypothetical protein [Planctomycetota bacterium]MEC7679749.1 hypothetical protein [Planctomycetota bacterium]
MRGFTVVAAFLLALALMPASAQISRPRGFLIERDRLASLQDQLTNRLRATRTDQKAYVAYVVKLVRQGKIQRSLVVAIERYAIRRNESFPFPFFERAMKFECGKRGVNLPPVKQFASTKLPATR